MRAKSGRERYSVRLNPIVMATLVKFKIEHGDTVRTMSQAIVDCVELKYEEIVNAVGTSFHTKTDALEFLDQFGLVSQSKENTKIRRKSLDTAGFTSQHHGLPRVSRTSTIPPDSDLERNRTAAHIMHQQGIRLDDEQLEAAQLEYNASGNLVHSKPGEKPVAPSGKTDGFAGLVQPNPEDFAE